MRRLVLTLPMLLLLAHPAAAADRGRDVAAAKKDVATIKACLKSAGDDANGCIGKIATPCQDQPDGSTTIGIAACVGREQSAWDAILNENYKAAMSEAKETDKRIKQDGTGSGGVADALLKAQRAWITYRDAECGRLWALNQEGTIRTIIGASCLNDLTAQRAIELAPDQN